jgi:flagellar assembly protein FliH
MGSPNFSSGDISALIDHLLKSKDPATVGLRKILKNKKTEGEEYPLQPVKYEEFFVEGKSRAPLDNGERVAFEMQKQINELKAKVEKYERDVPEIERNAYEKGRQDGIAEGEAAASKKCEKEYDSRIDTIQKEIQSFLLSFENSRKDIYVNAHAILLEFCFELSRKVINTEVSSNPDVVLSVIKKALSYISDRDRIVLRICKDDVENVSGHRDFWLPIGDRLESITIEADSRIDRGGCIVESNSGSADARLGVQFDELHDLVTRMWESVAAHTSPAEQPSGGEE